MDDLVRDQGQIAFKSSLGENDHPMIEAYKLPEKNKRSFMKEGIRKKYLYQNMNKELDKDVQMKLKSVV